MKKILTFAALSAASLLLAGCTLFGTKTTTTTNTTSTGEVVYTMETVDMTKEQCLNNYYQWDELQSKCEKLDAKSACLYGTNQWDEKNNRCEFSKDNCLAAGNQWNEEAAMCEYTKEQCLKNGAQWDEQKASCEFSPVTTEQQIEDCTDDNGQWDYESNSCQKQETMQTTGTTATTETSVKTYAMTEVKTHNSSSSCRTVVKGNVYDVTTWIPKHPGGPQMIEALCGKDGSDQFGAKHGGDTKPETMLASFQIGVLAK